jgi:hypothetical protein
MRSVHNSAHKPTQAEQLANELIAMGASETEAKHVADRLNELFAEPAPAPAPALSAPPAPRAIKAQFRKDVCVCGRRTCPWHNDMRIVPRNCPYCGEPVPCHTYLCSVRGTGD